MTKMERMSSEALSRVPSAAEKLIAAAEGSAEVAKETRAKIRRQRMTSQSQQLAAVKPGEALAMPDEWRDDEPTGRVILPHDEKHEKKAP